MNSQITALARGLNMAGRRARGSEAVAAESDWGFNREANATEPKPSPVC